MKSFKEYLTERVDSTSMVLYGRCSEEKLNSILDFTYENKSHVHFFHYDNGLYCFSDKNWACSNATSRYGEYILEFRIMGGIRNFLFTTLDNYKKINPNATKETFIKEQLKSFHININDPNLPIPEESGNVRNITHWLEEKNAIPNKIKGIEYYSKADGLSVIVFDYKSIVPIRVYDNGNFLVKKIDMERKGIGYAKSKNNHTIEKNTFNNSKRLIFRKDKEEIYCTNGNIKNLRELDIEGLSCKKFICHGNKITSLVGGPVPSETFDCSNNKINTLVGAPKRVKNFICENNELTSLCYELPDSEVLSFANNKITTMEDAYRLKDKSLKVFCIDQNPITSLKGGPQNVDDFYDCSGCDLTSLEGAPKTMAGMFDCSGNRRLTSLEGAPDCREIICTGCPIKNIAEYSKNHPSTTITSDDGIYTGGRKY